MPDWSRRRLLQLGVGALAATAGCSAATTGDGPSEEYVYVEDPEWESVRAGGTEPVVSHPNERLSEIGYALFVTESTASKLTFRREPDGVEAARSFLEATRFDEETLFVRHDTVRQCYRREPFRLGREPSERVPRPAFCTRLRPPDVSCSKDAEDTAVHLVRLPVGLEDPPNSYGFTDSSDCDRGPTPRGGGDGQ